MVNIWTSELAATFPQATFIDGGPWKIFRGIHENFRSFHTLRSAQQSKRLQRREVSPPPPSRSSLMKNIFQDFVDRREMSSSGFQVRAAQWILQSKRVPHSQKIGVWLRLSLWPKVNLDRQTQNDQTSSKINSQMTKWSPTSNMQQRERARWIVLPFSECSQINDPYQGAFFLFPPFCSIKLYEVEENRPRRNQRDNDWQDRNNCASIVGAFTG